MKNDFFDKQAATWDESAYRTERASSIAGRIRELIPVQNDFSVMEFGCGTGLLGFNFIDSVNRITFADTSTGMLRQIGEKADKRGIKNYATLNLAENGITDKYDIILSLMALHHIENTEDTVVNLLHHVSDRGYICLCDLAVEDGSFHFPEIVPHNGIDREKLASIVSTNGYEVFFNDIVHITEKIVNGEKRDYPVFLLAAKHR